MQERNLFLKKSGPHPKVHEQIFKAWQRNQTGNTNKNGPTISKNAEIEEKGEDIFGRKEQSNKIKINDTIQRDKSEVASERRRTKKILRLDQAIQTKQDIQKQQNFTSKYGKKGAKTYPQPNARETKEFWRKIWKRSHHYTSRINEQYGKRVVRTGRWPEDKKHLDSLK